MIKDIINSISKISDQSFDEISKILQYREINKSNDFIHEGRINNYEYFILEGIAKSYVLSPEGEEITLSFFDTKSVLSPKIIRTKEETSLINVRALTNLKIAFIDATKFVELMVTNLDIRNFGNQVLRNELKIKMEKEIDLASLSAKERLNRFRDRYPLFENLVAHSDIASYLGITNVSLSRLRSKK